MRPIIINADDYAMDKGVDTAILALAEKGRISSASAMVLSPGWPEAARAAKDAPAISWGLHLDLTSNFINGEARAPSLPLLMARAQARLLDIGSMKKTIGRQLALFEQHWGGPPDFVDGHQHVHQLPVVRTALLAVMTEHYGRDVSHIGVRVCASRRWRGAKAAVIGASGASKILNLARKGGHPVNSDFAGVYGFQHNARLDVLWEAWMKTADGQLPLIMCHVAIGRKAAPGDPIRAARLREYDWLASEEFEALCTRLAIHPQRWPRAVDGGR
jgi:predicted glycoside hydrolase/deacetylase ChbG (UPF0249 family)